MSGEFGFGVVGEFMKAVEWANACSLALGASWQGRRSGVNGERVQARRNSIGRGATWEIFSFPAHAAAQGNRDLLSAAAARPQLEGRAMQVIMDHGAAYKKSTEVRRGGPTMALRAPGGF